jgi:5-methyltetrahydrofolate--homocysteine methyltransferase
MERLGFKTPLLIGGATTSKVHTAVKIAQNYSGPVVHVNDASKSVPVASSLISKEASTQHLHSVQTVFWSVFCKVWTFQRTLLLVWPT